MQDLSVTVPFIDVFGKYIDITIQYNASLCILTQGDKHKHIYYCPLLVFVLPQSLTTSSFPNSLLVCL